MDALRELVRAGLTPEQIVALGQEAERRKQKLLAAGYPPLYVSALSGPELFALSSQATAPVVAGTDEMDRELQARVAAESALKARADVATELLRILLERAAERALAERSPYRFVDFLRNVSTLPQGEAANVIQSLTGRRLYIEPKVPVETPEERDLISRLMDYAKPQSPFTAEAAGTLHRTPPSYLPPGVTDEDIARVRAAYARDPVAAQRFFEEAARNPEGVRRMFRGFAQGGEMTADEPIVGMGLSSGAPRFILGEAGPEKLRITPIRPPFRPPRRLTARDLQLLGRPRPSLPLDAFSGLRRRPILPTGLSPFPRMTARDLQYMASTNPWALYRLLTSSKFRLWPGGTLTARDLQAALWPRIREAGVPVGDAFPVPAFATGGLVRVRRTTGVPGRYRYYYMPRERLLNLKKSLQGVKRFLPSGQAAFSAPPTTPPPAEAPPPASEAPTETVSPAQAAAMAMGRALQNNPFAPRELVNQLLAGQAPSPGYVTEQLRATLDPQLYQGLLGVAEAFGILPEQFEEARRAFFVPGARVYAQRF